MKNPDDFRALKRYGQNFLIDKNILRLIISKAELKISDTVLEIGAGHGILTRALLENGVNFLHAVELDTRLENELLNIQDRYNNFKIHFDDAVKFDYENLKPFPNKIIANIPYNITTPLIWHLLEYAEHGFNYQLYMLQKEAAERLTAKPKTKARYPLGITIEIMGSAKIIHDVPPECFRPVPKVQSAITEIRLDKNLTLVKNPLWSKLLHTGFQHRRKNILNNLRGFMNIDENLLLSASIQPNARAEELTSEQWIKLFNFIADK